jgi:predicted ATP-binding protein involved in virulence
MKKEETVDASRQNCLKQAMARLGNRDVPDIKQWVVNRFFMADKDWAVTEEQNWAAVIANLNRLTESDTEFSFNTIERDLEPSFWLNGNKTYLEALSSGFKSVLAIVFSIVEWIETTNEGEQASIANAKGTVLIDEIDAHLHPSWQI